MFIYFFVSKLIKMRSYSNFIFVSLLHQFNEGGGVAEGFKPLASKQEWNCRVLVRIPLMPRFHMPLIPTPPRVSTGMAHFSIMWQGSPDIALMQLKGT